MDSGSLPGFNLGSSPNYLSDASNAEKKYQLLSYESKLLQNL